VVTQVDKIVRVTFNYVLNGQEISEHSVCYRAGALPIDAPTINAVLNDMANAALASQSAHVTPSHWGGSTVCDHVRVALEDTSGHTLFEKIVSASGALAWSGTGSGRQLPYSQSIAISLYGYEPGNFDPFGRYKRGRFYLPPPTADVLDSSNTGTLDHTVLADIAGDWGTVLSELQGHTYSGFPTFAPVLVINSRASVAAYPVTWIRTDDKMDNQRRRQNGITTVIAKAPFS
jgi:hypothetical protein